MAFLQKHWMPQAKANCLMLTIKQQRTNKVRICLICSATEAGSKILQLSEIRTEPFLCQSYLLALILPHSGVRCYQAGKLGGNMWDLSLISSQLLVRLWFFEKFKRSQVCWCKLLTLVLGRQRQSDPADLQSESRTARLCTETTSWGWGGNLKGPVEMIDEQVKALATMPEDPSSVPRTHMHLVEAEKELLKVSLDFHMCCGPHTHRHTHAHTTQLLKS